MMLKSKFLKNIKNRFLFLLIVIFFFTACDDENKLRPNTVTCFDYSPSEDITEGDEITFMNCSENATTFAWFFGDGNVSTEENPIHIYETAGNFTVKLIAGNASSTDSTSKIINIDFSYDLPWKTEYIHYENLPFCGSHASGYKLYYKDSLLREECVPFNGIGISDSLLINDSILHLFFIGGGSNGNGCYDLLTSNGGYTWEHIPLGPPEIYKIHYVNIELIYCVTKSQNDLYFTGIGESNLSLFKDSLTKGTHYILDTGTNVIDIDSTLITLNDSIDFVIKFKE